MALLGRKEGRGDTRKVGTENNTNITNRMGINRGKVQGDASVNKGRKGLDFCRLLPRARGSLLKY